MMMKYMTDPILRLGVVRKPNWGFRPCPTQTRQLVCVKDVWRLEITYVKTLINLVIYVANKGTVQLSGSMRSIYKI